MISTYAGNGTSGFLGDGGPATAAEIEVDGMAVDPAGNLYISDKSKHIVRIINSSGVISTFVGDGTSGIYSSGSSYGDGGPATLAELEAPSGLCIDRSGGNLYIADGGLDMCVIRKVDLAGSSHIISTIAGNGTASFTVDGNPAISNSLNVPYDVKIDCNNNVYISEEGIGKIRYIDPSGNLQTFAGNGSSSFSGSASNGILAVDAALPFNYYVALDNVGNLFTSIAELVGSSGSAFIFQQNIRMVCSSILPTVSITPDPSNCTSTFGNTFHASLSGGNYCGSLLYDWNVNGYDNLTTSSDYTDIFCSPEVQVYCTVYYVPNAINDVCSGGTISPIYSSASNSLYEEGAHNNPPVITGIDINSLCTPGTVSGLIPNFTSTVTGGVGTISYNWSAAPSSLTFVDNTVSNPTVSAASPTNYTVTLAITDIAGCSNTVVEPISFVNSGWDLATKDNAFDLYSEPYAAAASTNILFSDIWHSQDIWNRVEADGHTNSTNQTAAYRAGLRDYIYVNVRNVGCADFSDPDCGSNAVLNTYWTLGGFGGTERWPAEREAEATDQRQIHIIEIKTA